MNGFSKIKLPKLCKPLSNAKVLDYQGEIDH